MEEPREAFEEGYTTKKGWVKREDKVIQPKNEVVENLKAEEINLARKIENHTKHLLQILNSIGGLTYDLNKSLLSPIPKAKSGAKAEQTPPQGWLEYHLLDLDSAICRAEQIYSEVTRLVQATEIEK